jgi:RND family efflux transporter MFP subunit
VAILAGGGTLQAQGWGPARVGVTPARTTQVQAVIQLAGSARARRSAVVASEVEGVVAELAVREGDHVQRGATLARLRNAATQRDLEGAKAQLEEAQARLELAQAALARSEGLRAGGVISQQQFDDAQTEVGAWQGRADQAQARIDRLEVDMSSSVIRAPFSGVIVRERCQLGEWVAAGGAVVEMVDPRHLDIVVSVPERHFAGARKGAKARVLFEALPDLDIEGEITAVIPSADPQTRTFPVKVEVDNADGLIGVGMSASVAFPGTESRRAVVVPKDAVVSQGAQRLVYRVDAGPPGEDGAPTSVATMVPVTLGAGVGEWIEATGIEDGSLVVTRGNERLAPGATLITEPTEYPRP